MFDTLMETVGGLGIALILLLGLFLMTRIPWWTAKVCVGGADMVEEVQAKAPLWRAQSIRWILAVPERLSVWGFFAFLLWPVMIVLNLVLLAQVLEMVVPGGERTPIPMLGSYTVLSLIAGGLFSLSQTVFGVAAGEVKKKSLVVLFLLMAA